MRVHYLATPARYRWMGITPTLPVELERAERPDVVHVFGFRDPVDDGRCRLGAPARRSRTSSSRSACSGRGCGRWRSSARSTRRSTAASPRARRRSWSRRSIERDDVAAAGIVPLDRIHVRGNGFPEPFEAPRREPRRELGIPDGAPIVLYVGRIAAGKGHRAPRRGAAGAARGTPRARRARTTATASAETGSAASRVHVVGPTDGPPLALYRLADVFVLPSAGESFGMVAAEAAAAGTPVVVTDRCGIAGLLPGRRGARRARRRGRRSSTRCAACSPTRLFAHASRRAASRRRGARPGTPSPTAQEELYRLAVASRTAASRLSTDGP